jgi:hypothetical protein
MKRKRKRRKRKKKIECVGWEGVVRVAARTCSASVHTHDRMCYP